MAWLRRALLGVGFAALAACGGSSPPPPAVYTLGGTVSGLVGSGLVLQSNAGDELALAADGAFTFATPLARGAAYAVTVQTQPEHPRQTCTVNHASGTATREIRDLVVLCSTNVYAISGTVTGLAGGGLVLQNNAGDDLALAADGTFTFATPVASGARYSVTVRQQPGSPSQTCTVNQATALVIDRAIGDVTVVCATNSYAIGGTVSGLVGGGLVLQNNAGDDLALAADGAFTFATPVASGARYSVTVRQQPGSQTCSVHPATAIVTDRAVGTISVLCTTDVHTISGTVTGLVGSGLVLQNNAGDDLALAADGAFTFATPVAGGAAYAVTVKTQPLSPAQSCTVAGGGGVVGAGPIHSVAVDCTFVPGFSYVAIPNISGIQGYTIDATGWSTQLPGSPFLTTEIMLTQFLVPHPSGQFIYAVHQIDRQISALAVNAATGALTAVGAPLATGTAPVRATIHPSGQFLYVTNNLSGNLSGYAIDAATGALTALAGSPFTAAGANPVGLAVHPNGQFAYVTHSDRNTVAVYAIDAATGALSHLAGAGAGAGDLSGSISIHRSGQFAYVTNAGSDTISAFRIDGVSGVLTLMAGAPCPAGAAPSWISLHPGGQLAYVVNAGNDTISAYRIHGATGALSAVPGSPFMIGKLPASVMLHPNGRFAYVGHEWNSAVAYYAIDGATGALIFLGERGIQTGTDAASIAFAAP